MNKISFDYNSLENNVMPSLNASISNLQKAVNEFSSLSIPYDFPLLSQLKNVSGGVIGTINSQKKCKNDIIDLNNKLDRCNNECSNKISKIQIIKFKRD